MKWNVCGDNYIIQSIYLILRERKKERNGERIKRKREKGERKWGRRDSGGSKKQNKKESETENK